MKIIDFGKRTCIAAVIALMVIAASRSANARVIQGSTAEPYGAAAPCMWIYYGAIYNMCGYNISVIIPLPYDMPGAKTINVLANATGPSANVGCAATTTDSNIWYVNQSAWTYVGTFGSPAPISLPIPGGTFTNGTMYMQCDIGAYGMVLQASYAR